MDKSIKKYLYDIHTAIQDIQSFMEDIHDFSSYQKSLKTKRAVERELEIIGEAMKNLLEIAPEISIQHAKSIISTRNRIIHAYDAIDDTIIWMIYKKYIPLLLEEIQQQLHTLNE